MARRPDTSAYTTFDQITARLEEIVGEVRKRDLPLESSLDLFDEAVALGAKAVDFVDTATVTAEEELRAKVQAEQDVGKTSPSAQTEGTGPGAAGAPDTAAEPRDAAPEAPDARDRGPENPDGAQG